MENLVILDHITPQTNRLELSLALMGTHSLPFMTGYGSLITLPTKWYALVYHAINYSQSIPCLYKIPLLFQTNPRSSAGSNLIKGTDTMETCH